MPPKVATSESTRHLLMRQVRARERGFGLCISTTTSFGLAVHFSKFRSCFELSKAANANCFDDITGFLVFPKIFRFGLFKVQ